MVRYGPKYKGIRYTARVACSGINPQYKWLVWTEPPGDPEERKTYNTSIKAASLEEVMTLDGLDLETLTKLNTWAEQSKDMMLVMEGDIVYYLVSDYHAIKVRVLEIKAFGGKPCSNEIVNPEDATAKFEVLTDHPEHGYSAGDKNIISAGGHLFVPSKALKVKKTGARKIKKFRMLTGTYS